jgi:enoyl-CoA hydratase
MDYQHLLIERDGPLATVTLNRPDKLNALDARLVAELTHAIHHFRFDRQDAPRVVILTGAGKAFVAGGDIATMARMSSIEATRFAEAGHRLCYQIEMSPFPVIAAVNGFALGGGCELMLACDLAYAADSAKLGQPEVNLGVIPGFGGTQRLARRVGVAKARELIYTGDILPADEALRIGLVNGVFPAADLLPRVREVALKIASKGPLAVSAAKRVLLRGTDIELATANELEIQTFGVLFGTSDQKEGMAAFLEKRKATFEGK